MQLSKVGLVTLSLQQSPLQHNFALIEAWCNAFRDELQTIHRQQNDSEQKIKQIQGCIDDLSQSEKQTIEIVNKQDSRQQRVSFKKQQDRSKENVHPKQQDKKHRISMVGNQAKIQLLQKEDNRIEQAIDLTLANKSHSLIESSVRLNETERLSVTSDRRNDEDRLFQLKKELQQLEVRMTERITELELANFKKEEAISGLIIENYKINKLIQEEAVRRNRSRKQSNSQGKQTAEVNEQTNELDKQTNTSSQLISPVLSAEQNAISLLQKQLQTLSTLVMAKNSSIDLLLGENRMKLQSIQKTIDLLERDQYVPVVTSKSDKQEPKVAPRCRKSDDLMNETGVTAKDSYEDRLIEIFNEIDYLKAECLELLNRMENEDRALPADEINSSERMRKMSEKLTTGNQKAKKQLAICKRDLKKLRDQFDQLLSGVNSGTNEIKTYIIKPNETKQDWKSLSIKIYKAKQQLQANVKELQSKIITSNDITVAMNEMEVKIEQCKIMINKRVELADFEKAQKRLENRLNNFIMQVYEKEGIAAEQDAIIAKQPWFCLSCDNELKDYTCKLAKNVGLEKATGKKVNRELHMVRRNENGRLPSVYK